MRYYTDIYIYVFEEDEIGREVQLWCTYMYDLFGYSLVGIYANMTEMPRVRQIDGSCRIFCRV